MLSVMTSIDLPECHCSECGAPMSRASGERVSGCCEAPRCNSAARRRYAIASARTWWLRAGQFTACCDAGAAVLMQGRSSTGGRLSSGGTAQRVAAW